MRSDHRQVKIIYGAERVMFNKKNLYKDGWYIIIIGITGIFLKEIIGINLTDYMMPCIFHSVTGLYCAGCGGTRAATALLHGEIIESLKYNPVVIYGSIIFFIFMFSNAIQVLSKDKMKCGMEFKMLYLWIALAIALINCFIKNYYLVRYQIALI